ncbi:MAG: hypothetical protein ACYCST_03305 [Acidimicrobiales bacterium]
MNDEPIAGGGQRGEGMLTALPMATLGRLGHTGRSDRQVAR